ncbi:thioesterase thiol ester dehydrase-isomerase protein [Rutstroemia sp. NJR-2017a WRK4]|nr:thioesterase thiol ester dehydrase-isomerase protein [Rutstroemia sp. NJR-2017a WRK4]
MPPRLPSLRLSPTNLPYLPKRHSSSQTSPAHPPSSESPSRWLATTKSRIGKCIMFGLTRPQARRAAGILEVLGRDWRELVAGRQGFLVDRRRAGLYRHRVVWGEMDSMGHVNNVAYIRYAESARVQWVKNYAVHIDPENSRSWMETLTPRGDGLILRSIKTFYRFPMTWPDHISVYHKLRSLPEPGSDNFTLDVLIVSELRQRVAASCVEDIVLYDYKAGRKTGIKPFMMDAFETAWEEQLESTKSAERKIEWVEERVRELERESWDREGAVEDMGGGS